MYEELRKEVRFKQGVEFKTLSIIDATNSILEAETERLNAIPEATRKDSESKQKEVLGQYIKNRDWQETLLQYIDINANGHIARGFMLDKNIKPDTLDLFSFNFVHSKVNKLFFKLNEIEPECAIGQKLMDCLSSCYGNIISQGEQAKIVR